VYLWPQTTKSPAEINRRGFEKRSLVYFRSSVAQFDRPAEAGVVVPVMMREAEHLL